MPRNKFYAVVRGGRVGIFSTWDETKPLVHGFPGAKYRGFSSRQLAADWMEQMGLEQYGDGTWGKLEQDSDDGYRHPEPARRTRDRKPLVDVATIVERVIKTLPKPVEVYTDGSSLGNGQAGARAGYGVYYGEPFSLYNISKPVPRDEEQTNNRGELHAIIRAVKDSIYGRGPAGSPLVPLVVRTDSEYAIKCVFEWSKKWKTNGWKTANGQPVKNKDLIESLELHINHRRYAYYDALISTIAAAVKNEEENREDEEEEDEYKKYSDDDDEEEHKYSATLNNPRRRRRMEETSSQDSLQLDPASHAKVESAVNGATKLEWVKGHAGEAGNEAANWLAISGARMQS